MSLTRILNGFATKTAAYNLVISDDVVLANGTFTVYLPPASAATGRPFTIKNINTGTITLTANGAELIDGTTTVALNAQETITVSSTGSKWHRLSRYSLDASTLGLKTESQLNVNSALQATLASDSNALGGQSSSYYRNATNINAGTLAGAYMFVANSTVNGAISTTTQTIAGDKTFSGATTFSSTTAHSGAATFASTAGFSGAATFSSTAVLNSTAYANGQFRVDTTNGRLVIPVGTNKYAT